MTEVQVNNEKFYISSLMDLFNREIIGFEVSSSPNQDLIKATIEGARKKRRLKNLEGILIHSDQGSVYRSHAYNQSRKANCWDNAVIESFFSHLKVEFPCFYNTNGTSSFKEDLKKYICYFNEKRIQSKLGYVSPKMYYNNYQMTA